MLTIVFHVADTAAQGHKYLMLERGHSLKKIRIYPGSTLRFKFEGDKRFYSGKIKDLRGDMIIFENSIIKVQEIAGIDISEFKKQPPLLYGFAKKLPVAGAGYFLIDQFNRSVVNGQSLHIDRKVLRTSAIMVGVGLLLGFTVKNNVKIRGRNRLRIVNLLPEANNKN
ncbi:hypothetical protein QQ020_04145 [Fulvivirgaceae bacterium BMA12]|uniref:Uncharacterized protein n=1 Tax=Agaribacillus aureus TaxID=3051825 RepID=A0ABT8L0F9_9BACT|nr:hypothetical protein [Fulvivirgaceae bacterium BMA12]